MKFTITFLLSTCLLIAGCTSRKQYNINDLLWTGELEKALKDIPHKKQVVKDLDRGTLGRRMYGQYDEVYTINDHQHPYFHYNGISVYDVVLGVTKGKVAHIDSKAGKAMEMIQSPPGYAKNEHPLDLLNAMEALYGTGKMIYDQGSAKQLEWILQDRKVTYNLYETDLVKLDSRPQWSDKSVGLLTISAIDTSQGTPLGFITTLQKKVQPYDKVLAYTLKVRTTDCAVAIRINDVPVNIATPVTEVNTLDEISVNQLILSKGPQQLHIKILPGEDENGRPRKVLPPSAILEVTLMVKESGAPTGQQQLYSYQLPRVAHSEVRGGITYHSQIYPGKGVPSLEAGTTFNAEVPYQLGGWTTSEALTAIPDIKQELIAAYHAYRDAVMKKDMMAWLAISRDSYLEKAQAGNYSQEDAVAFLEEQSASFERRIRWLPVEQCEVKFYGNGKLATLVSTDPLHKGRAAMIGKAEDDYIYIPLLFHKKKGSHELTRIR